MKPETINVPLAMCLIIKVYGFPCLCFLSFISVTLIFMTPLYTLLQTNVWYMLFTTSVHLQARQQKTDAIITFPADGVLTLFSS